MTSCESISQQKITYTKCYMIPQTNITMTNTVTMTTVIRQNHTNELYMLHDARWNLRKSMSDILLSFAGTKRSKYYHTHLKFH